MSAAALLVGALALAHSMRVGRRQHLLRRRFAMVERHTIVPIIRREALARIHGRVLTDVIGEELWPSYREPDMWPESGTPWSLNLADHPVRLYYSSADLTAVRLGHVRPEDRR